MIKEKYSLLKNQLDEKARRLWAASEALVLGGRGVSAVHRATGLSRTTIAKGIAEIKTQAPPSAQHLIAQASTRDVSAGREAGASLPGRWIQA
jgi:DNA-binding phage protein